MCPIGIMALIFPIPFNFFEKIDLDTPPRPSEIISKKIGAQRQRHF
jgi:hypothetical protein